MSQHTAGPWGCEYTSFHAHDYRLTQQDGNSLPLTVKANDHSEQRANAQLIAAAPDLLAAAWQAIEVLNQGSDSDYVAARIAAKKVLAAAIAKAEGRES